MLYAQFARYTNSMALKGKEDVAQFDEQVFRNLGKNPEISMKYGKILEFSLFDIIKNTKSSSKKTMFNLSVLIQTIKEEYPKMNREIHDNLDFLRQKRNHEYHFEKERGSDQFAESKPSVALDCAIKILHYLVWKYECLLKGAPEKTPQSCTDEFFYTYQLSCLAPALDAAISFVPRNYAIDDPLKDQYVDTWGIIAVKSRLHAMSQLIADEAEMAANNALVMFPYDAFTRLIPLVIALRWYRGYLSALTKILNVPEPVKKVGDYPTSPIPPLQPVSGGLLSAREEGAMVIISLDAVKVLTVSNIPQDEKNWFLESINNYGRLGMASSDNYTLTQRIANIELRKQSSQQDDMCCFLNTNREALLPLIARYGMAGSDWLLPHKSLMGNQETNFIAPCPEAWHENVDNAPNTAGASLHNTQQYFDAQQHFDAHQSQSQTSQNVSLKEMARQLLHSPQVRALFGDAVDKEPETVLARLEEMMKGMQK